MVAVTVLPSTQVAATVTDSDVLVDTIPSLAVTSHVHSSSSPTSAPSTTLSVAESAALV